MNQETKQGEGGIDLQVNGFAPYRVQLLQVPSFSF